jgi:hypothetical protein
MLTYSLYKLWLFIDNIRSQRAGSFDPCGNDISPDFISKNVTIHTNCVTQNCTVRELLDLKSLGRNSRAESLQI